MHKNPTYRQCHLGREAVILFKETAVLKEIKQYTTFSACSRILMECLPTDFIFIPAPSVAVADLIGEFVPSPYIEIYYSTYNEPIIFPNYLKFDNCVQYSNDLYPCKWHTSPIKMYSLKWWQEWCKQNIIIYEGPPQ